MAITIPADLTIVTLRENGRELTQRWTAAYAASILQQASALLKSRTNIEFPRASCQQVIEEMPAGAAADTVDEAGYHFLTAAHKASNGVRVLLVDQVSRPELGGQSRREIQVCLIAYGSDAGGDVAHARPRARSSPGAPAHRQRPASRARPGESGRIVDAEPHVLRRPESGRRAHAESGASGTLLTARASLRRSLNLAPPAG